MVHSIAYTPSSRRGWLAGLMLGAAAFAAHGADRLEFVDGPGLPEDLAAVPASPWVLVSSMAMPGIDGLQGGLFAIDRDNHAQHELFPDNVRWGSLQQGSLQQGNVQQGNVQQSSAPRFADCPGRPDMKLAAPHGINVREGSNGRHQVLAVNHGGREAIEVFELDVTTATPQLTWVGCVPLPERVMSNGVAPLADGGFVVTNMFDPTHAEGRGHMLSGAISGYVLRWHPERGWSKVEGTDLSAPNGIEVSPNGDALFVASWTTRKLHRFPLGDSQLAPISVSVDFMPDNLRWGTDGSLLITGQDSTPAALVSCVEQQRDCTPGFKVLEIDPATMQATERFVSESADFHSATVALGLDGEIWVGSLSGPRIGRIVATEQEQ